MKVLVCGGRNFIDKEAIECALNYAHDRKGISCLIHGDCRGVDRICGDWAKSKGVPVLVVPANWDFYGNKAGPIRNKWMIDFCKPDLVVGFEGGKGTEGMIKLAQSDGIEIWRPKSNNKTI